MDVEEKGIMPRSQTGFRKGLGVVDNIYFKLFDQ